MSVYILIKISLEFVPKDQIDNKSRFIQVMASHKTGTKPVPEPTLSKFYDAILHHQHQWIESDKPILWPIFLFHYFRWKIKCKKLERDVDHHQLTSRQTVERNEQMAKELENLRIQTNTGQLQMEQLKRELGEILVGCIQYFKFYTFKSHNNEFCPKYTQQMPCSSLLAHEGKI